MQMILKMIWNSIKPIVNNKYLLTGIFFVVWVIFFDQNNLIDRYKLVREVDQLQKNRVYYIERIKSDSARLNELRTSPENLEKFAREQYLMKRDNEEIFVIVEE